MNLTLFKSLWAVTAALIAAAFVLWLLAGGAAAGARAGSDPVIVLWSGWATLALMLVVCLYSLRKFAHRLGISPEFRMKRPLASLESAERGLNEIRRRIMSGVLADHGEVEALARDILRREGVHRLCRAEVVRGAAGGPPLEIVVRPTEPLGRVAKWLHFHAYLGLASGVTLWVHGGLSLASPIGAALNLLALLVVVTGVLGMALYGLGPSWMTRAERDMSFERAFVREQSLKRKLKEAYAALKPEQKKVFKKVERTGATAAIRKTALEAVVATEPESKEQLEDIMVLVSQRERVLRDLRVLRRIRFAVNAWRLVHVPASILLLAVALVHAVSILWY